MSMQDPDLLNLFRQEVNSHTEALDEGLLEWEKAIEDLTLIEPIMRAAHSLKGAARIIGLDIYSDLAHELEDCFVAAQKGDITIDTSQFDILLKTTDALRSTADLDNEALLKWPGDKQAEVDELRKELKSILKGQAKKTVAATQISTSTKVTKQKKATEENKPIEERKIQLDEEVQASLLKAFKKEVMSQASRIKEYLEDSLKAPERPLDYSYLTTAAVAIKSSCNLAHRKDHVQKAIDLEQLFTEALKDSKEITEDQKNAAITTADTFIEIASGKEPTQETEPKTTPSKTPDEPENVPISAREVELEDEIKDSIEAVFKNEVLAQATSIKEYLEKSLKNPDRALDYTILNTAATAIKSSCNLAQKKEYVKKALDLESLFTQALKDEKEITEEQKKQAIKEADYYLAIASCKEVPAKKSITEAKIVEETTKVDVKEKEISKALPVSQKEHKKIEDPVVKISAINLNRLMSLAAELLVETQRLAPLKHSIVHSRSLFEQQQHLINSFTADSDPEELELKLQSIQSSLQEGNQLFLKNFQEQLDVFEDFSKNNNIISSKLYNEVLASRMRPFQECSKGYPRLVRDLSRSLEKKINLKIIGEKAPVDRDILEKLDAPLNHLLRNACDHGIETPEERRKSDKEETGTITLEARHASGMLLLTISDDGKGIDKDKVLKKILEKKLIPKEMSTSLTDEEILDFLFLPGFSTTTEVSSISGRGVGLDVVRTLMQEIGGDVRIESSIGIGTKFLLHLPITRSVIRVIMVDINGEPYAFPLSKIRQALKIQKSDTETLEGHSYFHHEGQNIAMICANQALGFEAKKTSEVEVPVIIIGNQQHSYSLVVSSILGETELVVRPLDPILGKVPCISAASITKKGIPILIADVEDIVKSISKLLSGGSIQEAFIDKLQSKDIRKKILIVDDSPTVLETQKQLLTSLGYAVETASDGMEGWHTIRSKKFDLVITDIDMPRMNGFELLRHIKNDPKHQKIPVIVVSYKDRPEDRLQGKSLGAIEYLTKSSFRDSTFTDVVKKVAGDPQLS